MDYNKINFEVIEECLVNADSKEQIQSLFLLVATNLLSSDLAVLTSENLPLSLKQVPKTLNIANDKALVLLVSLHNLMKEYIGTSMLDENILANKFPQTFKKPLKSLLFKVMREWAPTVKKQWQDEFSSGLPKLRDFDWRLDVKTASKQ